MTDSSTIADVSPIARSRGISAGTRELLLLSGVGLLMAAATCAIIAIASVAPTDVAGEIVWVAGP